MRNNVKGSKNSIIPNMPKQKMIVGTLPQIFGLMQGASFLLIQKALQRWDAGCGITHPARLGTPPQGKPPKFRLPEKHFPKNGCFAPET